MLVQRDSHPLSFVYMLVQLLMTSVAILKVDDLGRKPLLIGGISGIVCVLFLPIIEANHFW